MIDISEREKLKADAGLTHMPTDLTYELRMAVSGHKSDEFLSWGYQWEDKPHRLVHAACAEAEYLAAQNAELVAALRSVIGACDKGRLVPMGAGGMTIEAQTRNTVIHGVPLWPIEEARTVLDEIKTPKPSAAENTGRP